ncbi:hypothetical protein [Streptomyces malaysiensis]|uniref:hypothetical protein n=1 Tax=Streptomyces TaxID=1883 RepID=UPI003CCCD14E
MDTDAIRAAIPHEPIAGSVAADRIAVALGTPNPTAYGQRANVTAFVVRRLIARGLLTELSGNPDGSLVNPTRSTPWASARTWPIWSPPTRRSVPTRPPNGSG